LSRQLVHVEVPQTHQFVACFAKQLDVVPALLVQLPLNALDDLVHAPLLNVRAASEQQRRHTSAL
jgi:hypothetical protein